MYLATVAWLTINSELEYLAMDTWRAPQWASFAHLPDQVTDLASRSRRPARERHRQ
jgi:hypothetical protein